MMPNKYTGVLERDTKSGRSDWRNSSRQQGAHRPSSGEDRTGSLPDWSELDTPENRRIARAPGRGYGLAAWPTARLLAWLVVAGLVLTLYVGHVHATKQLLAHVQDLRRENLQLHLKYNRLRGELQEAAGPTSVYDRARQLGLHDGHAYGPTIYIER